MIWWLAACSPSPEVRYDGQAVVRVPLADAAALDRVRAVSDDLWTEHPGAFVDARVDLRDLSTLPADRELLIPDLQGAIEASGWRMSPPPGGSFYDDWRPLDEVLDHLDELASRSPHAEVLELGTSLDGLPIRGLRLDVGSGRDDRPGLLVTGVQHAREWVAGASAVWIAEQLVDGYGVDPVVTDLLDGWRVLVVPIVNPDGYDHTWTTDRLWRKNRRDNLDGSFGVDLNRNWDAAWGGAGSSGITTSNNYRGTAPFSEPETSALRDFVESHPRYSRHLDLHCTGQLVLTPFGFTPTPSPDDPVLSAVALDASVAMAAPYGTPYDPGSVWLRLYPAAGVGIDWTHGVHGMQSFLFELRDRGAYGFLLPADQLVPTAEEAWEGFLVLATEPTPPRLHLAWDTEPVAGGVATLTLSRGTAGAEVALALSLTGPGSTAVPGGPTVELAAATRADRATVDALGRAHLSFRVPPGASGSPLWVQAFEGTTLSVARTATVP